jgi:hypothetical protein
MSDTTLAGHNWVAFGPAGAVGSIHGSEEGFAVKLLTDPAYSATYPTLDVAKSALHSRLLPGSEWPEFKEH